MTHTPGPWRAERSKLNDLWTVYCGRGKNIAAVHDPYGSDDAVCEANARLAAAAPELLEALRDTARILDAVRYSAGLGKNQLERLAKAKAAIAKAETRTPQLTQPSASSET